MMEVILFEVGPFEVSQLEVSPFGVSSFEVSPFKVISFEVSPFLLEMITSAQSAQSILIFSTVTHFFTKNENRRKAKIKLSRRNFGISLYLFWRSSC